LFSKLTKTIPNIQKMNFQELKEKTAAEIKELVLAMDQFEKMQCAINSGVSLASVLRYAQGGADDIKKMDIGEKILEEAKKIMESKVF
jgi:hypothetical protein